MKLMTAFTKKGYWYGRKYLVFKSYGNKVKGVLQAPALEDEDGYIVYSMYTSSLDLQEQLSQVVRNYLRTSGRLYIDFRVFDENGEPYEVI